MFTQQLKCSWIQKIFTIFGYFINLKSKTTYLSVKLKKNMIP